MRDSLVYGPSAQPGVTSTFLREVLVTALARTDARIVVLSPTQNLCLMHFDLFVWLAKRRNEKAIHRSDPTKMIVVFDNASVVYFQMPPAQLEANP